MKIIKFNDGPTLNFAADELVKYLKKMVTPVKSTTIQVQNVNRKFDVDTDDCSIKLGLFDQFDIEVTKDSSLKSFKNVKDKRYDDAIYINIEEGRGIIAGINSRSVLIAVYRFLNEVGCRWVRPGADGEYIPRVDIADLNAYVAEKASYRHRGICIEGASSYENIRDIIDWAPKVGFNSYFFQFREAYTFFERWYSHRNNPYIKSESFSVEHAREYVSMAVKELKLRDMLYHAVGHGWTCEPLGIPGLGWESKDYYLTPEIRNMLAEVNGKRDIWEGVSLNTNLCYSNEKVRKLVNEAIVEYLQSHPNVDILHFWLADGSNNQCECKDCQKAIPSDFYVMMLNELDDMLTKKGIDTKIVFLIYVDLLWPPMQEKIKNQERFIMMFAPISRTYNNAFDTDKHLPPMPPYQRNQCTFPTAVEENLSFLKGWKDLFQGDSFDFDYHFMWAHYKDPGYYRIARILHTDLQNLQNIGLNGFISCQTQRAFFPVGLGMYVMGKTLWNRDLNFDIIAEEYFQAAFGKDGTLVQEYLAKLSQIFEPLFLEEGIKLEDVQFYRKLLDFYDIILGFEPILKRNLKNVDANQCIQNSWKYLKLHESICINMVKAFRAKREGDFEKTKKLWNDIKSMIQQRENEIQNVLDVFLFIHTLESIFTVDNTQ